MMTDYFHVASGLEQHMREWLLRATHADRDAVDAHIARYAACDRSALREGVTLSTVGLGMKRLQHLLRLLPIALLGLAAYGFTAAMVESVVLFVTLAEASWRPWHPRDRLRITPA